MTMSIEDLSAHEEIRQAIYRHFRAADRLDPSLVPSAFWDDGRFEGGPMDGPIVDVIPHLFGETMTEYFTVTNHYMMNMVIDLRGHEAFVEVYAMAYHVVPGRPETLEKVFGTAKFAELKDPNRPHELVMGIRYSVRMECREAVWKIAVLKLIVDWSRVEPYSGITEGGVYDILHLRGGRGRADPSYPWHP